MNELYNMKVHDEIEVHRTFRIVRVPGGWIYYQDNEQVGGTWQSTATFVPFNKEFQVKI